LTRRKGDIEGMLRMDQRALKTRCAQIKYSTKGALVPLAIDWTVALAADNAVRHAAVKRPPLLPAQGAQQRRWVGAVVRRVLLEAARVDVVAAAEPAKHEGPLVCDGIAADGALVVRLNFPTPHDGLAVGAFSPCRFPLRAKVTSQELVNLRLKQRMLPHQRIFMWHTKNLEKHEKDVNTEELAILVFAVAVVRVTNAHLELALRGRALEDKAHGTWLLHN
jgi:hypothetical protein